MSAETATEPRLEIRDLTVAFGNKVAVERVSLKLAPGHIGCLLGPSGCGKTTLLRTVAGFEQPDHGSVRLRGKEVARPGRGIAPEKRRIGMVFQDFALFPHLTVAANIAFGIRRESAQEQRRRTTRLLEITGLAGTETRYPHQLSGGQQQRVALARALAPRPEILLLDEPFSSLDVELREQLAREVRAILKRLDITAVLVTHDQLEAFAMADEIGVMREGRLHQWDSAHRLYHHPRDRFVADFIGQGTMLHGRVADAESVEIELGRVKGWIGDGMAPGDPVEVLIRPDDIIHDDASPLRAAVVERVFRGAEYLYTLGLPSGARVLCLAPSHHDHPIGERIGIRLEKERVPVFRLG